MPTLVSFKSKLFKPCKRLLRLLNYKRPVLIRAFRFRNLSKNIRENKSHNKKRHQRRRLFRPWRRPDDMMDELGELRSFTETARDREPFPSPLTPAYIKNMVAARRRMSEGCDGVEAACRSFEKYLVEMVVSEGKVGDLMDVEELLYCWNSLKSPVFIDLVCRFYGELCKDLFSTNDQHHEMLDEDM